MHRLWPQIDDICKEQLRYARQGVGEGGNGWQLFADEGEMKMYRREQEIDGMVVDPLKACHMVKGVTAREMCHYFFMPEYRNDWESKKFVSFKTFFIQFYRSHLLMTVIFWFHSDTRRHGNIRENLTGHNYLFANA